MFKSPRKNGVFAKTAVFLFFDWSTAWNLLARPMRISENNPVTDQLLLKTISEQLSVNPEDRPNLTILFDKLKTIEKCEKSALLTENLEIAVSENTQASVPAVFLDQMASTIETTKRKWVFTKSFTVFFILIWPNLGQNFNF